ncbi:unnamed protein product [Auanema sp. JU1783]|nr:unnamed protein product [Auanema sp. JU1783]
MWFFYVFLASIPMTVMSICPMENHQVCNSGNDNVCVCALIQSDEKSAPESSCNTVITRDEETEKFPVVSIEFNLDEKVNGLDEWPEESFRDVIASSLRVEEEDIIVLRVNCGNTEDQLTVQFGVLKKDSNDSALPYTEDDFIDAKSLVSRMKAMGHLNRIADMDVDTIEFTDEMIEIEFEPSNDDLIFQAVVVATACIISILLGLYYTCKGKEYSDDLQKV